MESAVVHIFLPREKKIGNPGVVRVGRLTTATTREGKGRGRGYFLEDKIRAFEGSTKLSPTVSKTTSP